MAPKIYVCHQGTHIFRVGTLGECQACKLKLPETTWHSIKISDVEDYGQECYDTGYDSGYDTGYENGVDAGRDS